MNKKTDKTSRKGFQTPHEKAKVAEVNPVGEAKQKGVERDAFGGRVGTRMSKINLVVIDAGDKGATVPEVAKLSGEPSTLVSAQLGWMVSHKKVATRKQETGADAKKVFRYFANAVKTDIEKGSK